MNEKDRIAEAMETARSAYEASRSDYDAGRYEGLKEALEILEQAPRSAG